MLGADWVNSARGFMFAVGCIQSQSCHTNHCPTGVATQDPLRQKALVVPNKAERVYHFHQNTVKALADMLAAAGVSRPEQLTSHHMLRRITPTEIKVYADIYYYLERATRCCSRRSSEFYARMWRMATPNSFDQAICCRRHDGIRDKRELPLALGKSIWRGVVVTAASPQRREGVSVTVAHRRIAGDVEVGGATRQRRTLANAIGDLRRSRWWWRSRLPVMISGITDASTTRNPSMPCTRPGCRPPPSRPRPSCTSRTGGRRLAFAHEGVQLLVGSAPLALGLSRRGIRPGPAAP